MRESGNLVNGPKTVTRGEGRERLRRIAGSVLLGAAFSVLMVGFAGTGAHAAASGGDRAEGAELFKVKGCTHCHGVDGAGTARAPSLMTVGKRLNKTQIEHQIREGGKVMPSFGGVLSDDQIHKLVDYLAHKKKAPKDTAGS